MNNEYISLLINDIKQKGLSYIPGFNQRWLYSKPIMDKQTGNIALIKLLEAKSPFMVSRFGTVECQAVYKYLHLRSGLPTGVPILPTLCNNAGFFPEDIDCYKKFGELMLDACKYVDILAVMRCGGGENYLASKYCLNAQLMRVGALDPIHGWTSKLENKKVLVIHPFVRTIREQYHNHREEIFPQTKLLPQFELKTLKAVQTIAGVKDERFSSWFEALDYMENEAQNIDFDVALIGCGAYGFPLAARIKNMGKQAIHMGGALQLLFGIRGQRWDNSEIIKPYINDAWVRPSEIERPSTANKVEGACYW